MAKRYSNIRIQLPGMGGMVQPLSKTVFQKYDKSRTGYISTGDFSFLCSDMGYNLSPAEIEIAVKLLDKNGDGQVNYDEFAKWWGCDSRFKKLQRSEEELINLQEALETFKHFSQGKCSISRGEFQDLYKHLFELGLTKLSLEESLKDLDEDNSNSVSLNEYVDWCIRKGKLDVQLP